MSYVRDIDELSDTELLAELSRRRGLARSGRCTYCHRFFATCQRSPCKSPRYTTPEAEESP